MVGSLEGDPKMASGNGQTAQKWCSTASLPCCAPLDREDGSGPQWWSTTPPYSRETTSGDMWRRAQLNKWDTSVKTCHVKKMNLQVYKIKISNNCLHTM